MSRQAMISSIEIYKLFIPLKEPFVISLGPVPAVQNVVVIIYTKDGCTGYGECSPYMTINGESVDTCFIVGQYLAKALKDKDALDLENCSRIMDAVIYANTSIKSAFDMALHDIAAQQAGLPLYKFLGGEKNKVLHTDMTISLGTAEKMKADAIRFKEQGFPAIKVKIGESLNKDVARIKAIREGIGNSMPLRIDANQGWETAGEAIAILHALAPYNIEHCEEPIPRWRFMELSKVSAASRIPVMADESCGDEHDAERLIQLNACPMFNIKLGKSSGFVKAMKMIRMAANAKMQLQIGGFMESRLGMTAAAHLAFTNECIVHCDFDTPLMFTEDPVAGGIEYKANGVIELPDTPGLGASIEKSYLQKSEKALI
jgi:L-alanine-DL-glutamate epimerase-like enolase superfamily enzyme